MTSLTKIANHSTRLAFKNYAQFTGIREAGHWNRDYMPGPYPITPEERRKAAEKYGMHPKEYEPYPDDGWGHGDYPKLPNIGAAVKDPHYPYDHPKWKRNFGEPMHAHFEIMTEDKIEYGERRRFTHFGVFGSVFAIFGTLFTLYYLSRNVHFMMAAAEKQFPTPGVVHYTFEPADK